MPLGAAWRLLNNGSGAVGWAASCLPCHGSRLAAGVAGARRGGQYDRLAPSLLPVGDTGRELLAAAVVARPELPVPLDVMRVPTAIRQASASVMVTRIAGLARMVIIRRGVRRAGLGTGAAGRAGQPVGLGLAEQVATVLFGKGCRDGWWQGHGLLLFGHRVGCWFRCLESAGVAGWEASGNPLARDRCAAEWELILR